MRSSVLSGISPGFPELSRSYGQVTHVLLTRPPLTERKQASVRSARLACIRHAASVRPEPGSNSPKRKLIGLFNSTPTPKVSSRLRFSYCPAPARNALRKITFLRRHASMSRRKNIFLSALDARLRFSMWTLRFVQFSKNIFSSLRPFYANTFINKMSILFSLSLSDVK
jgi:hypothetical protein